MNRIEEARERYRPEHIKLIFIAEAPPCNPDRFFYYEDVNKGDSLFLHIIRAVFPDLEGWPSKQLRAQKEELLFRFMDSGYFLEHSVRESFPKGTSKRQKEQQMRAEQAHLIHRLQQYKKQSKIILISSMVYKINHDFLIDEGFQVLNDFMIPYPGSGQQTKFKTGIAEIDLS